MILGIGIDVVKVERIKRALELYGEHFANRIFTGIEKEYCSVKGYPAESYAGRFAVKEAAFKALGKGWYECGGFTSVEVINNDKNQPRVVFHGMAGKLAGAMNVKRSFVSITHDGNISAAVVVLEG